MDFFAYNRKLAFVDRAEPKQKMTFMYDKKALSVFGFISPNDCEALLRPYLRRTGYNQKKFLVTTNRVSVSLNYHI